MALLQPALFRISSIGLSAAKTAVAETCRVECDLNKDMSIPAPSKTVFTHRPKV